MNYLDYEGLNTLTNNLKYLSNPNILINSNFKINQRDGYITKLGITSYSNKELTTIAENNLSVQYKIIDKFSNYASYKSGDNTFYVSITDIESGYANDINLYTVDRWKFNDATSNVLLINNDYITLIGLEENVINGLQQCIENPKDYAGKYLTFSALVRARGGTTNVHMQIHDGRTYHILNHEINNEWKIISVIGLMAEDILKLKVEIGIKKYYTGTIDIKWAKLEQNKMYTNYIVPDISSELFKCKRFYQRIGADSNMALIINPTSLAIFNEEKLNYMDFYFELSQPMRTTPTAKFYGISNSDVGFSIGHMNGNNPITDKFTYSLKTSRSRFRVTANLDPNIEVLKFPDALYTYHLIFYANSGVELDAELYI